MIMTPKQAFPVAALFLDIGGVLLTDGWGHESRAQTAMAFDLDTKEMENRHHQAFDTYEAGKLSLADYLNHVVFYQKRPFSPLSFRNSCSLSRSRIRR